MNALVERHVKPRVVEALADTRVVVVQGARQVGKTTMLREIVDERGGRLVTFDDEVTRAAAQADPVGFLGQIPDGLLAIDEVQRVPEMVLALKLVVDRDPRPGRFLVTGSANLLRLPAMEDSLAGRAESVELHGFSQGEIEGVRDRFIDRVFDREDLLGHIGGLTRNGYLERAIAGTYPEVLARSPGRRRNQWLDNYLLRIVERDAPEVSNLGRLNELPLILRVLASRNAEELNISGIANDVAIPASTLGPHIDLLETLYLIQRIPAWSTNLSKRVISRPKVMLLDMGLAARMLNVSAEGASPMVNGEVAGHLLEGFVVGELRRQIGWAERSVRLSHYRDRAGDEIDVILEAEDGSVAGIEVKSAATVGQRDTKWLVKLRDRLGDRFVAGIVLHTGTTSAPFGDRISAVPMDVLWAR